jgi:hypothetical protein
MKQSDWAEIKPVLATVPGLQEDQQALRSIAIVWLGKLRLEQQRYTETESLLRKALDRQQKRNPAGWKRYDSQSHVQLHKVQR